MKRTIQFALIICICVCSFQSDLYAQKKKYLIEEEEVIEAAHKAIEKSMAEGDFKKFAEKSEIKGSYIMDITIKNKGEVASVKTIDRNGEIVHQNELKDFVISYRFPFKMQKNKSYKFRYEFKF